MQQLAIEQFRQHLVRQERSIATVEKYIRDTRGFLAFIDGKELTRTGELHLTSCARHRFATRRTVTICGTA